MAYNPNKQLKKVTKSPKPGPIHKIPPKLKPKSSPKIMAPGKPRNFRAPKNSKVLYRRRYGA